MKLYQTALKYHSDGPAYYSKAAEAYRELFESDIFRYPESLSELQRIDLYGPLPDSADAWLDEQIEQPLFELNTSTDNAPSTLPQILHLSHKNYGDFMLDFLQSKLATTKASHEANLGEIQLAASSALDHFVQALDKDDTDLDLWRRSSSLATLLSSERIARFCLEAILDGEDEGLSGLLSLPGLSESTAGQQLCELIGRFNDHLSLIQRPLSGLKRTRVSKLLRQRLEIFISIRRYHQNHGTPRILQDTLDGQKTQPVVLPMPLTWTSLAEILLTHAEAERRHIAEDNSIFGGPLTFAASQHQSVSVFAPLQSIQSTASVNSTLR